MKLYKILGPKGTCVNGGVGSWFVYAWQEVRKYRKDFKEAFE